MTSDRIVEETESDGSDPEEAAAQLPAALSEGQFGTHLEPALRRLLENQLSEIHWFRADWQRGGALTGYAYFRIDEATRQEVVVKLPVPPCERRWLVQLQHVQEVVPRVYAHGEKLGGYDMAWVVMERLPYGPLGVAWAGLEFDLLIQAAGRFYAAAQEVPVSGLIIETDWCKLLQIARQRVRDHSLQDSVRWSRALKKAQRKLKQWIQIWEDRPGDQWCHGDLHLGNAMTRVAPPGGPALLFDFARTRPGHWVEDAVYLEHLYWGRRERLGGRHLIKQCAQHRKELGLEVGQDWTRLADIKRALTASATPAMLHHEGNTKYVTAALEILERAVG